MSTFALAAFSVSTCPDHAKWAEKRCAICAQSTWQQERGGRGQRKEGGNGQAAWRAVCASWRGAWTDVSGASHVSVMRALTILPLQVGLKKTRSPVCIRVPLTGIQVEEGEDGRGRERARHSGKLRASGNSFVRARGENNEARQGRSAGRSFRGNASQSWIPPRASGESDHPPSSSRDGYGGRGDDEDEAVSTADGLRVEIASLQEEMEETQAKASAARNRFVRLANAVERLQQSAAMAMKEGDEATTRRVLKEKSNVMGALEKSHERAKILEALAKKLGEVISKRETELIVALTASSRRKRGGGGSGSGGSSSAMHSGLTSTMVDADTDRQQSSRSAIFYAGEPGEGTTVRGESGSTSTSFPPSMSEPSTCSRQDKLMSTSVNAEDALGADGLGCRQRNIELGEDDETRERGRHRTEKEEVEEEAGKEEEEEEEKEEEQERLKRERISSSEEKVDRESRQRIMDEEELQARFLDMERSDLERMYQRSPALDAGSSRATDPAVGSDGLYRSTTQGRAGRHRTGTTIVPDVDSSQASIRDDGVQREQSDEDMIERESYQRLSHGGGSKQKDDDDDDGYCGSEQTSDRDPQVNYLADVDLQIALVKRKLDELRRSVEQGKEEQGEGGVRQASSDLARRSKDEKLKAAGMLLSDLLDIRAKLSRLQMPGQQRTDEESH